MRAHAPTIVVFSLLSLAVLALAPSVGRSADAGGSPVPAPGAEQGRDELSGVPEIVDGDSIKIGGVAIRLHGIDAPEMAQACKAAPAAAGFKSPPADTWKCGVEARRALTQIIGHGSVTCTPTTLDRYGRTVARCFTQFRAGGADIGAEMVRRGMAWAFVRYSADYVEIEREAKAARRGIWQAETQAAWDFRMAKHQQAELVAPEGCAIKGNVSWTGDRIYHLPWSPWYANVRMDGFAAHRMGKRWFCNEAEAVAAGWRPAAGG